jgi:hypothetical protein
MNQRYAVFPEWQHDQKRYRIYDKETDSLLGLFDTLEEATGECTRLTGAPRGGSDEDPRAAAAAAKASVGRDFS